MSRPSLRKERLAGDCAAEDVVEDPAFTKVYKFTLHGFGEMVKCLCCPFSPFSECGPIKVIEQGSVGVITRFGIFERAVPPGMYVYNVMTQRIQKVQMRMQTIEVPRQAAMTQDNLVVQVDAVTFVTVVDASRALFQVEDYRYAVKTLAASTLLRIIAEHSLQQIFTNRMQINAKLTQTMQEKTAAWGLQVSSVEMRDIAIPDAMQRAMAQIAEANREADAKVITAQGQKNAASILADAAEIMERQPISLQLQWFETLRQISSEKSSTVIVPDSVIGSFSDLCRASRADRATASMPLSTPLLGAVDGASAMPVTSATASTRIN